MPTQPTPARLEAFSDGVIAVIITIMVLDLHVPREGGWAGLRAIVPTLATYLLSFVFTGIYWINHGHLIDRLKQVNPAILWTNFALLFALSLLPFCTAYLIDKHFDSFSVALYAMSLLLPAFSFQLLSYSIGRHLKHARADQELEQHRLEAWKGWVSFASYLAGALLAFPHPHLALALLASVTLIWIVPTFGTHRAHGPRSPDIHTEP
jgi:uncharacterized membrane protein